MFPSFQFQWLADEVRRNLPQELDFRLEANNMNKCSQLFKSNGITFVKVQIVIIISSYSFLLPFSPSPYMEVPEVYVATQRLLIMEFCEGGKINNLEYIKDHNLSVNEV